MCSQNDAPPYDRPRCEKRLWSRGAERPCGAIVGVHTWKDATGKEHAACHHHIGEQMYRYPEAVLTVGMSEREAVKAFD
jgi:hypothetical protein